eukprot:2456468-Heterocapsa_arctica.AAC.1
MRQRAEAWETSLAASAGQRERKAEPHAELEIPLIETVGSIDTLIKDDKNSHEVLDDQEHMFDVEVSHAGCVAGV